MPWAHELSAAFRSIRRSGPFAVIVTLMLALAIGTVTSVYSIAHAVLLRPLPIVDPDSVLLLWGRASTRMTSHRGVQSSRFASLWVPIRWALS